MTDRIFMHRFQRECELAVDMPDNFRTQVGNVNRSGGANYARGVEDVYQGIEKRHPIINWIFPDMFFPIERIAARYVLARSPGLLSQGSAA